VISEDFRERIAVTLMAGRAVWRAFTKGTVDDLPRWLEASGSPTATPTPAVDLPTILMSEVARSYASVAELGAMDGSRMFALKQRYPAIKAYAVDIGRDFGEPRDVSGVTFMRHTDQNLARLDTGTLICAVRTLYACPPQMVRDLFTFVASRQMSLFYLEPVALTDISHSIPRRSVAGYYHPYKRLAAQAGLRNCIDAPFRHLGHVRSIEPWSYGWFASPPADRAGAQVTA
jgi:hypothetical protein